MPRKLFDEEAKEVEVKTDEEIKAETDAAVAAAKTEVQEATKSQIETLTADFNKAKQDLDAAKANGGKSPEELAAIAAKEKEVQDKEGLMDAAKAAGVAATLQMYTDEAVEKIAGSDAKLKEAIVANMKPLTGKETKAQVNIMLRQASVLAFDSLGMTPNTSIMSQNFGAGGGSGRPPVGAADTSNISSDLRDLGGKFGVTDEDWKKWGNVKLSSAD